MRSIIDRFRSDRRGTVYIEAAFALPVLLFLVMASIELGRYLLLNQKLQNAAMNIADLAARDETLTVGQLDDMFTAVNFITDPFDFPTHGKTIVTGVSATVDDAPEVFWQRADMGATSATSQVGNVGGPAAIASNLPVRADETIIVAEVFYDFEPFFGLLLKANQLRHVAYFRPRLGTLQTLDP